MFYENRAKSTKLRESQKISDKTTEKIKKNESLRINAKTPSINSPTNMMFSMLDSQSPILVNRHPLTESRRLRLLKKEINRNDNRKIRLDTKEKSMNITENDQKEDKIKDLFKQIIFDQNEGIKSPIELKSSARRRPKKTLTSFRLNERIQKSIVLPMFSKEKSSICFNFANPAEVKISEMDSEKPYKFSSVDSKYQEILKLKRENASLKREIMNLKNDKLDKYELTDDNKYRSNENFNEKRIALLKNQIIKQQSYIKNLHKSLRLIKKFYRDMTSLLLLFKNLDTKYSDILKNHEHFLNKRSKNIFRNDTSFLKEIDETQKFESMQKILHSSKNSETLELFINNFNEAYERVKTYERKNEELKRMFDITDSEVIKDYKEKAKKIKYNYLLNEFIDKYRRFFPIKTFFDIVDPKDKESMTTQLNKLVKLMSKIEEIFHQITSFNALKNNIFFDNSLPASYQENLKNFEEFFGQGKKVSLSLNYQHIFDTESSLSILLKKISSLHILLSTNQEVDLENLMDIQSTLRKNIEKLLHLGISLNEGDDPASYLKAEVGSYLNTTNFDKIKSENLSVRKKLYKNENTCDSDFQKISTYLQESISDLEENIFCNLDESANKKLSNFKFYLLTLNQLYEQKKVTSFLKDIDLNMQTQRVDLINKGFESLKAQIFDKIKSFEDFFFNVNEKVLKISQNFEKLFDEVNEEHKKKILAISKKLNNLFKFLISNLEKKMDQKEFNQLYVNTEGLQKEYEIKVKIIEDKWGAFMKKIQKISEKMNQKLTIQ